MITLGNRPYWLQPDNQLQAPITASMVVVLVHGPAELEADAESGETKWKMTLYRRQYSPAERKWTAQDVQDWLFMEVWTRKC